MSSKQHENTYARRQALQVMFQQEFLGFDLSQLDTSDADLLVVSRCPEGVQDTDLEGEPLSDYAGLLLGGIVEHLDEIDSWISDTAQNWTLERMPLVDRNIIRLASYEVAFCDDIPTGVAINEAVEIAKSYGGDDSPKFVNGVLGKIATRIEDGVSFEEPAALDASQEPEASEDSPCASEPDSEAAAECATPLEETEQEGQ